MKKLSLILLVMVLAWPLTPGAALAPSATVKSMGAAVSVDAQSNLSGVGEVGFGWVRAEFDLTTAQPAEIATWINTVHHLGLQAWIGAMGEGARVSDPDYQTAFAGQLAELAQLGADAIEVWRAPNSTIWYGTSDAGQVNPENYVNLLRTAYTAIKKANAQTRVISAAPIPTGFYGGGCTAEGCDDAPFFQRMAKAGAAHYADCIGAALIGTMISPAQTDNAPVFTSQAHQWYFKGTLDVAYNAFRGAKPVCWTMLGYFVPEGIGEAVPDGFAWASGITLHNQAEWLAQAITLSRQSRKVSLIALVNWDVHAPLKTGDVHQSPWNSHFYSIIRPDGSCPACLPLYQALH